MKLAPLLLALLALLANRAPLLAGADLLSVDSGGTCSSAPLTGDDAGASSRPGDTRDPVFYPSDTERIKPLGTKLVKNILIDQKEIWLSPFHINRQNAGWWALTAGVTGVLISYDRPLSHQLENSPGQVRAGNNISRLGATYTIIPAAAGFYLAGVLTDNAKARDTGVLGAEAMLDALIVSSVVKTVTARNRPNAPNEAGHFFSGGNSFPSGHAISTWALASVVAHEYSDHKFVPIAAYGLATLVTAARFGAQQHYASDLVAGAVAGWFIGRYVYNTHEEHRSHVHAVVSRLAPRIEPSTRTYALNLNLARQQL
jgi:membrane-associated phospholipid phosphatase